MSSVAAPFGLNPIGRFDAGSLEVFRQYPIKSGESTAIVKGDIVQLVNASNATTIAKMTGTMDGSATDLCARDIYGKNAPVVQNSANTTLGISRVALDASEISTNAGDGIKIIDYLGGDLGDEKGSNFPILVCKFNYHQLSSTSGAA